MKMKLKKAAEGRVAEQQAVFLKAYAEIGTIKYAAEASGIHRTEHYGWIRGSPEYAARFCEATDEAVESMEREARRRAVEGVEEPVGWHRGEPGGYVRKYSDVLLIFLLKAARPEKYREQLEVVRTQVREREMGRVIKALEQAGVTDEQLETARSILLDGQSGDDGNRSAVN